MSKLQINKPKCVRCHKAMFNPFRKRPWCDDCTLELQQLEFNGEAVLEMVLAMMPPTPPHPDMQVRVRTVQRACQAVLLEEGLLLPLDDDDSDGAPGVKSKVLLG